MRLRSNGDFQLGADAIRGGEQKGIDEAGGLQVEQSSEAAKAGFGAGPGGLRGERFDRLDQRIARIDVDARLLIGVAVDDVPAKLYEVSCRHRIAATILDPERFAMCFTGFRLLVLTLAVGIAQCAIATAQPSRESADLFTAKGVAVDATAETAAAARDVALNEGQQRALDIVLRRITLRADQARLPSLEPGDVAALTGGLQVKDEKTSTTRYLASLTVNFKKEEIRELLRQSGIPFTETRAKPTLVLPVFERAGALLMFDDENPWLDAWTTLGPRDDALLPLTLPLGDLADLAAVGPAQAVAGDEARLNAIGERYDVENVMVAHGKLTLDVAAGGRPRIDVDLRRYGPAGSGVVVESFAAEPEQTLEGLLDVAARRISQRLEEEWKRETLLRFDTELVLSARLAIGALDDWTSMRDRLQRNAMISRVELTAISRRDAQIVLYYLGQPSQLAVSLAQDDVELIDRDGYWELRLRGVARREGRALDGAPIRRTGQ